MEVKTPLTKEVIDKLHIGDQITITGKIYCGRDAALPKLMRLYEKNELEKHHIDLQGGIIFHTAVSEAGIGPTSSNKVELEGSMPLLSQAGIKMHLGKGKLSKETVKILNEKGAVFAVTPPISALLTATMTSKKIAAFPEEGIEALYEITVKDFPAIIAIAHGESIFERE